ncbi:hypothetical protein [Microseira sp. BLCC-F43]|uniref:hypothetical protein n=1 Tax=Microseira sp. BLCC-F43 TaxID=3153602 RepID=UPI0035B8499A
MQRCLGFCRLSLRHPALGSSSLAGVILSRLAAIRQPKIANPDATIWERLRKKRMLKVRDRLPHSFYTVVSQSRSLVSPDAKNIDILTVQRLLARWILPSSPTLGLRTTFSLIGVLFMELPLTVSFVDITTNIREAFYCHRECLSPRPIYQLRRLQSQPLARFCVPLSR